MGQYYSPPYVSASLSLSHANRVSTVSRNKVEQVIYFYKLFHSLIMLLYNTGDGINTLIHNDEIYNTFYSFDSRLVAVRGLEGSWWRRRNETRGRDNETIRLERNQTPSYRNISICLLLMLEFSSGPFSKIGRGEMVVSSLPRRDHFR